MKKLQRAKLQWAKRQTRKKWRGMLRDLPGMTRVDFLVRAKGTTNCGFCIEYMGHMGYWSVCEKCPALAACNILECRYKRIGGLYHWRKPAAELCRWVLREIGKVKEN